MRRLSELAAIYMRRIGSRWGPCPACGTEQHRGESRGVVRLYQWDGGDEGWSCCEPDCPCSKGQDALALVAWGENHEAPPPKGAPAWREPKWRKVIEVAGLGDGQTTHHPVNSMQKARIPSQRPPEAVAADPVSAVVTQWPAVNQPDQGVRHELTLDDLVQRVQHPDDLPEGGKEALDAWNGSDFVKGYRDGKRHVKAYFLFIDYDSEPQIPEGDIKRGNPSLEKNDLWECFKPFGFVAHTTARHKEGRSRWRLILPLSRGVSSEEYKVLAAWTTRYANDHGAPGLDADTCWHSPVQAFYVPAATPTYDHLTSTEGSPLDVDACLREQEQWLAQQEHLVNWVKGPFAAVWFTVAEWGISHGTDWLSADVHPPKREWLICRS